MVLGSHGEAVIALVQLDAGSAFLSGVERFHRLAGSTVLHLNSGILHLWGRSVIICIFIAYGESYSTLFIRNNSHLIRDNLVVSLLDIHSYITVIDGVGFARRCHGDDCRGGFTGCYRHKSSLECHPVGQLQRDGTRGSITVVGDLQVVVAGRSLLHRSHDTCNIKCDIGMRRDRHYYGTALIFGANVVAIVLAQQGLGDGYRVCTSVEPVGRCHYVDCHNLTVSALEWLVRGGKGSHLIYIIVAIDAGGTNLMTVGAGWCQLATVGIDAAAFRQLHGEFHCHDVVRVVHRHGKPHSLSQREILHLGRTYGDGVLGLGYCSQCGEQ